jgi:hypothetical protein
VTLGALISLGACSSPNAVDRVAFEARMRHRHHLDREQAACVGDYVYKEYDASAIRTLYEAGLPRLAPALWNPFAHALLACAVHDEVGGG